MEDERFNRPKLESNLGISENVMDSVAEAVKRIKSVLQENQVLQENNYKSVTDAAFTTRLEKAMQKNFNYINRYKCHFSLQQVVFRLCPKYAYKPMIQKRCACSTGNFTWRAQKCITRTSRTASPSNFRGENAFSTRYAGCAASNVTFTIIFAIHDKHTNFWMLKFNINDISTEMGTVISLRWYLMSLAAGLGSSTCQSIPATSTAHSGSSSVSNSSASGNTQGAQEPASVYVSKLPLDITEEELGAYF